MTHMSVDTIESQLAKTLNSPEFKNSPKLGMFLSYVVAQSLNGESAKLTQYKIAVEGLGYNKNFNPSTNPTVRILARRLRRALKNYYANGGVSDPVTIQIPKGGYAPVFAKNQTSTDSSESLASVAPDTAQVPFELHEPTIGVCEFVSLNTQGEHEVLAVGLTGEILVGLTRFAGLKVLGPLQNEHGPQADYRKLHQELNTDYLLQGWIRSYGSQIRITIDLIEGPSGVSPWGQTFDFDLTQDSLFKVEDEVTSRVVGVIADGLGIIFRKLQSESYSEQIKFNSATQAVLAYNYAWTTHAPSDWKMANTVVNDAMDNRPDSALLVALQSNIYYADVLHGLRLAPNAKHEMEALALKAVDLDPDLQIAQYNLVVQHAYHGRVEQCTKAARKVVAMNSNHARVLAGCAVATTTVGAYELGKGLIERAKNLNPHYPGWYYFIDFVIDFHHQRYEKAWSDAQLIHVEGLLWHPIFRASILGKLGRDKEAKPYIDNLLQIKPDFMQQPREYIRHLLVTDEHVDMIYDGLLEAGLNNYGDTTAST